MLPTKAAGADFASASKVFASMPGQTRTSQVGYAFANSLASTVSANMQRIFILRPMTNLARSAAKPLLRIVEAVSHTDSVASWTTANAASANSEEVPTDLSRLVLGAASALTGGTPISRPSRLSMAGRTVPSHRKCSASSRDSGGVSSNCKSTGAWFPLTESEAKSEGAVQSPFGSVNPPSPSTRYDAESPGSVRTIASFSRAAARLSAPGACDAKGPFPLKT